MADIRIASQVTDFVFAAQNPVQPPWFKSDASNWPDDMYTNGAVLIGDVGDSKWTWTTAPIEDGDGEVWGDTFAAADVTEGWRMGLLKNLGAVDGYVFRWTNGIGDTSLTISRYDGGSGTTLFNDPSVAGGPSPAFLMLRLSGSDVEVWKAESDVNTWTLIGSVSDSTHRTGLFPSLGISSDDGTGPGWAAMGATIETFIPQIYRRPTE